MNLKAWLLISIFLLAMPHLAQGRAITVGIGGGYDFDAIQAAIDDANDGDRIVVADGTYTGDGNRDIEFVGKAITVRSENGAHNCIIDCNGTQEQPHRGFYFHSGEGPNSVVWGMTVVNGYGREQELSGWAFSCGGAIYCASSSPTIADCIFRNNSAAIGGGAVLSWRSGPTLSSCVFSGNSAYIGGAVCSSGGAINNCVFSGNKAIKGGGVFCHSSDMVRVLVHGEGGGDGRFSQTIVNSTFFGNRALSKGSAIFCSGFTDTLILNCIAWGDGILESAEVPLVFVNCSSRLSVRYSDVQGEQVNIACGCEQGCDLDLGPGNIDADPCFGNAGCWDPNGTAEDPNDDVWVDGDHHLKSQAGRWDPRVADWVQDDVTSPCIDAGNPMSPIGCEPFPNGGVVNMGAYGRTPEASKSYSGERICERILAGDINGDCRVDFVDFAIMAFHWVGVQER